MSPHTQLAIDRSQLAERIFVTITAGHGEQRQQARPPHDTYLLFHPFMLHRVIITESHVDKEEVYKVAQVIGSDELELTVKSILATRRLDDVQCSGVVEVVIVMMIMPALSPRVTSVWLAA